MSISRKRDDKKIADRIDRSRHHSGIVTEKKSSKRCNKGKSIDIQILPVILHNKNLMYENIFDFTDIHEQVAPMGLIFLFFSNFYKQFIPNGTKVS